MCSPRCSRRSTRCVIINKGRLVTFSSLAELTARLSGGVRVRAPGVGRLQNALAAESIRSTLLDGNELLVDGAPSASVGEIAFRRRRPAARAGARVVDTRGRLPRAHRGGAVMIDQLLSELRKMRSTRTNLGLLAGMIALIAADRSAQRLRHQAQPSSRPRQPVRAALRRHLGGAVCVAHRRDGDHERVPARDDPVDLPRHAAPQPRDQRPR